MQRPFSVTLNRLTASGTLSLRLGFADALSEEQRLGWLDLLKTFVEVAQCGALSGAGIDPARSGCIVVDAKVQGHEAMLELSRAVLDPAASTVLLNLCHWAHAQFAPLGSLVLAWDGCGDARPDRDLVFPDAFAEPGFPWVEYELTGQTVAVDVEFMEPQSELDRQRINTIIGHWFKAANWGGYADELFAPEVSTLIIASPPLVSDELGISWYFDACHCSDSVFGGLINCLARISSTDTPIRHVTIGE